MALASYAVDGQMSLSEFARQWSTLINASDNGSETLGFTSSDCGVAQELYKRGRTVPSRPRSTARAVLSAALSMKARQRWS
eukprot:3651220-Amphidinium_carterae.1